MQPSVAKFIEICRDLIEIESWKLEIFKVLHPLGGQKARKI